MRDIIQAVDLCFSYGNETVLKNMSFSVKEESFTAVIGPNGSGKSTLARLFNALLVPTGGKLYIDGMDTSEQTKLFDIRSHVGMVFQNPDNQMVAALVEDEVAFAPENLGVEPAEIRRRVDKALETVGMSGYAHKATAQLSGGQKQRVAVAGVLAMEPKLIILDEATAMLDPKGRREVMEAVRKINREKGTAVVYITHYMEEAALADKVIVIKDGGVFMEDTPGKVFSRVEELTAAGLDIPQITKTAYLLRKAGFDIRADVLNAEELYKEICGI